MKRHFYILLTIFFSNVIFSQNSEIIIEDLKPAYNENVFPTISYSINSQIEAKLNTLLQLENLEHLPNCFKINPFEKVAYDQERDYGSVHFYGYEKTITPDNILGLMLRGEATGAYSETFEIYYNFDLRTGNKINLNEFLTKNGINALTNKLNQEVRNTIEAFVASVKENPSDDEDFVNEQLDLYTTCLEGVELNSIAYYTYYFEKDSITFVRGRCSNHAMRAIDDLGSFKIKFSYNDIAEYSSKYAKGLLNGETKIYQLESPEGKFYKGKIDNKYPITVLISQVHTDNSLHIQYWYDKYKTPIEWNGNFLNNHFSLIEYDAYDEEKQKWVKKAAIEADLIANKIIGTWTNLETNQIFELVLTEY
ncbi:MAG: hypothetical protein GQ574_11855 [Crocinitomix sp.]|nr:hypothetical protein [Crocinitomix sp.]